MAREPRHPRLTSNRFRPILRASRTRDLLDHRNRSRETATIVVDATLSTLVDGLVDAGIPKEQAIEILTAWIARQ